MTLPQRIAHIVNHGLAALHPCVYGDLTARGAVGEIAADLQKEIALLCPGRDAKEIVDDFVAALPEVRRLVETDVQAAYDGDPAATSRMEVVMAYPGLYAVTIHRLAHVLYKLKVPIIPRVMSELEFGCRELKKLGVKMLAVTGSKGKSSVVKAVADGFEASVTVTNTGKVAGKEVVEVYVSAPAGGLEKPACELKAFGKTRELKPGESQTLTFKVRNYDIASFNEANSAWEAPAGAYKIHFGASVADVRATATYQLKKAASFKTNKLFALDAPLNELHLK